MIGGGNFSHVLISNIVVNFVVYLAQMVLVVGALKLLGIPFEGYSIDIFIINYGQHLVGLSIGM